MRNAPLILGGAWLALCAAVVLFGMVLRLSPLEMDILPFPFFGGLMWPAALVMGGTAFLLLWVGGSHARARNLQVPWAQLILFHPLLLAFVWLVLPVNGLSVLHWSLAGCFAVTAVWMIFQKVPRPAEASLPPRQTLPLDLAVIALPMILGLALGAQPDFAAAGLSLLLYPLFALVQLGVFLVIPAPRLSALGLRPVPAALITAAVFALMHAPNPVVMLATFAAMFVWTWQYARGRRVWQLAVVMGLSATVFSQFLPDSLTHHMRVGPVHMHQQAKTELVLRTDDPQLANPGEFLEYAYPLTVGRKASAEERAVWQRDVSRAIRTTRAWNFFISPEYARKAPERGWPAPPPEHPHWTAGTPEWRSRIKAYGAEEYFAKCGGHLTGFTKTLYRDILQRPAGAEELAEWPTGLTEAQRWRLAEILL
nr:CPBP family intramembrane glutamic endopeptidase [Candidatus Krumholzibacteria bacterium]